MTSLNFVRTLVRSVYVYRPLRWLGLCAQLLGMCGVRNWASCIGSTVRIGCLMWCIGSSFADRTTASEPNGNLAEPITVAADWCMRWEQGAYEVWYLQGNCYLNQGLNYTRGPEAVLWIDRSNGKTQVVAYFEAPSESQVVVDEQQGGGVERKTVPSWFKRLDSSVDVQLKLPPPVPFDGNPPTIYQRGRAQFDPAREQQLRLAQFTDFTPVVPENPAAPAGMRRIEFFPRSDVAPDMLSRDLPTGERVVVVTGGIRVLVEGLPTSAVPTAFGPIGTLDISTDRAVIWTAGNLGPGGESFQGQDVPLEIYMEGNIEFRQGDRVVYADRMFYDVRRQVGVILNAELLTPLPMRDDSEYQGLVRLRARAIRQLDEARFTASDAFVTTSRLEEPAYHFASNEISFEDFQTQSFDPFTGQVVPDHRQMVESQGNFLYLRGIPVFYWPTIATDLTKPSFFIDRIRVGNDSIFGTQVMVGLDAYQMLGIRNAPAGTDWVVNVDYLSERGLGHGTNFAYDRLDVFGHEGSAEGAIDFWGIYDTGLDNLGLGRQDIVPEADYRFRLFGEHRHRMQNGWEITGELGWLSDRTFLEQYYEQEWDEGRDPRTGLRAKRIHDNQALSIEANARVNDFFTETQWLPRVDHYWLGESLFGDNLTWFAHSQAAYANMRYASTPTNPDLAILMDDGLPWEIGTVHRGERIVTRQELDLPVQVGAVKVVPFFLGELAHWGEDFTGNDLQRAYMHTGVRASVPFWAAFPDYRDSLFNLNGLAHKVVFDAEFSYADSNRNFDELPLYDPLDDISIIEMRRRVFDATLPPTITDPKFFPTTYALRSGMQGWVTSPTTEIADDLMALRMGMRNRWQTKRGGPGRQHIVDWLTLDSNITFFPKAERDNFGEHMGLFDYDMRWHVGDRFTILSDGAADFFGDGLRMVSGGVLLNRPTRGNAYLGARSISGPVESNALLASYSYRVSQKWITSAGAAYDFSDSGRIGQSFSMTRIGESMLVSLGVNVDALRDNVGIRFMVEPRFLPKLALTQRTGIEVPPVGTFGLE